MAIAGGGTPGKRMGIYQRQLRQVGLSHNVPETVIEPVENAAILIAAGESVYIAAVGNHAAMLQEILEGMGLVDPVLTTEQWIAWARMGKGEMSA